jgi:hypothetical protein
MNPSDVITAALSGDIDEGLDGIIAACGERKKVLSRSLYYTLNIGDRVRFVNGRPKYMIGVHGTVVGKKQSKLVVDLDETRGRFGSKGILCPPSCLEKL